MSAAEVERLSDEEWAPIWQALRACRAWDDAPVPLLHQNDERHVRHTLTPALRAHVAAAVAEAGESGLRARVEALAADFDTVVGFRGAATALRALLDSPADDAADEGA